MRTNRKKRYRKSVRKGDFFVCGAYCIMLCMILTGKIDVISNGNEILKNICLIVLPVIVLLIFACVVLRDVRKMKTREKYLNSTLQMVDAMSGEEFEEFLKTHFEELGYHVQLTPKSNDYGIDLICKKRKYVENEQENGFVVQAKRYKGKVGVAAVQQVIAGAKYYDCKYGMVITNSYFTSNAWELAKKSGITLWDRNVLHEKFKIKDSSKNKNVRGI